MKLVSPSQIVVLKKKRKASCFQHRL